MNFEGVANIASICAKKGIKNVILSPGSRNAPLILAFARTSSFDLKTVSDERSAGFIALGMALKTQNPSIVVCTSGSAGLNYEPAVAEAYFQQVPLVVITADRPPEWIDQHDGQTIRQNGLFEPHIKGSFQLPVDIESPDAAWHHDRIISEAINLSRQFPMGPVHINAPFREPIYPTEPLKPTDTIKIIEQLESDYHLSDKSSTLLFKKLHEFKKILVVRGQGLKDTELSNELERFSSAFGAPIVADVISNLHNVDTVINHHDLFLPEQSDLSPDLLITFGKSVLSKNLKLFLRNQESSEHWHIQEAGYVPDTYQVLTQIINGSPKQVFQSWSNQQPTSNDPSFKNSWMNLEERSLVALEQNVDKVDFNELEAVHKIMSSLPNHSDLHLSNSMSVRYANLIGLRSSQKIEVFANRGTSGIDGCTGTAIGSALCTDQLNVLITGDMAFFYDRNSLWHNYTPSNLRIIVLNNHGGVIFGMIEGPTKQTELEEYFETRQELVAKNTAAEFGLDYSHCSSREELKSSLDSFFENGNRAKILEIEIDKNTSKHALSKIKKLINEYDS